MNTELRGAKEEGEVHNFYPDVNLTQQDTGLFSGMYDVVNTYCALSPG